jgi:Cu+-exporting ATPase
VLTTTSAGDLDHTMSMSMTLAAAGRASEIYLEVGATLVFVILLGRWLEARARYRASDALRQLAAITPRIALRINTDGGEEEVLIDRISPGDCVRVRVGDRIPVDGVVREGTANIDRSLVTGEATPAAVAPGDEVAGGTVNLDGVLAVEALRVGAASTIGQIALLVQRAQTTKAPIERRADQVAGIFVPVVILLAALTAVTWTALGASSTVIITNTVAVLIVACPCALGLATPAALMVASGRGAKLGLIISGAHVLESSQQIDTVVFDKTGTITTGQFAVSAIDVLDGDIEADEVLRRAASVEQGSAHPLAHALVAEAQRRSIPLASISLARPIVGGMAARVDRVDVQVGHERVLERYPAIAAPDLDGILARHRAQGRSVMIVAWDERVRGVIACADQVRAQSAAAIDRLRAAGVQPILLTGDHEQAARSVGAAAGFEEIRADALPEHKIEFLEQLARDGRHVAMVGDGINDAPALAAAQLGIAMGAGSDAAQAASDMTIVSNDLSMVPTALQLARRTFAIIRGNLFWAFFYNVAALPLAATGRLTPIVAAVAMSASSLFVVGNSMRLRRVSLDGPSRPSN